RRSSARLVFELAIAQSTIVDLQSSNEPISVSADHPIIDEAREAAVVLVLVIQPLEDGMHEMAVIVEAAELERGAGGKYDGRLIGNAPRIDVALPVIENISRCGRLRRVECRVARHAPRNALHDVADAEVEARF